MKLDLTNPELPSKRKNPYWDEAAANALNREQKRAIMRQHRARRASNLALGCALWMAATGSRPIIERPKTVRSPRVQPSTVVIDTSALL